MLSTKEYKKFIIDEAQFVDKIFVYKFSGDKNKVKVFFLYLIEDKNKIEKIVKDYSIEELPILKDFSGFVEEEVSRILNREKEILREREIVSGKVKELYNSKVKLLALKDYYSSEEKKEKAISRVLESKKFSVIRGFVQARESDRVKCIEKEFFHKI